MTAKYELIISQGADFLHTLTLKNDDRTLIDLTGYTFRGQIRKNYGGKLISSFTFNLLDQVTNMGQVEVSLPNSFYPEPLDRDISFVYDIEMVSPGLLVTRVLYGSAKVIPQVTI